MKAIVANLSISSLLAATLFNHPALANPQAKPPPSLSNSDVGVKLLTYDKLPIFLPAVNIDRTISINNSETVNLNWHGFDLNLISDRFLSLNRQPFTYRNEKEDLIFGLQNTFWPSQNQKYWGVTTVEHFGKNRSQGLPSLSRSNYTNEAPTLSSGSAVLTISGGGNRDSASKDSKINPADIGEVEDFRGGVTYHQSLSNDVTVGVGFVYEDLLRSFSQFTYQSSFLPLRTTVSLLTGDRGLEVHSHIRLQPSNDFTLDYYNESEQQRFKLNWAMLSGLSLTARGNSQQEMLSAGLKIAVKSEYFALFAKAELDNNQNWNWRLDSKLGSLQLIHAANRHKTQSEINLNILELSPNKLDCSLFFKYETRQKESDRDILTVWGGSLGFQPRPENKQYRWKFDLGYGFGSQGSGAIASAAIGLKPNLSLKLTYEEVSALSDDTNIKLQLTQ